METIVDRLRHHCKTRPVDTRFLTWISEAGKQEKTVTFSELALGSQRVADALRQRGVNKQDRAVLVYPPNALEFVPAFMGCLWAGVIAGMLSDSRSLRFCCVC